jgi:hypothetical protein
VALNLNERCRASRALFPGNPLAGMSLQQPLRERFADKVSEKGIEHAMCGSRMIENC